MKRREFLRNSLAASALAGVAPATITSAAEQNDSREFYEWRVYRLKPAADHSSLDGYLEKALVPALNRLGSKPVGVFTEIEPKDDPAVFALIPYPSFEVFATSNGKLSADAEYLKAGAEYLETAKSNPAFVRIDAWLLRALAGMPRINLPEFSKEKKTRIFEVRTYESYSEAKAQKKVDMFNNGEIEIMRDVQLGPIFFGQALIGSNLPHITYMLSAETREAHKQHFAGFGRHPKWRGLAGDSQYRDTVSKSTSRFLQPTAFSQI